MFLKVYLFLSALGLLLLHAGALQLVASRGYSLVVVRELLIVVVSLEAEHWL